MDIFALILKIAVILLCAIAAFEDFRHLRIRNDLCLGIAILFIPFAFTLGWQGALWHLAAFGAVFVITAILFFTGLFGGGDAKFLSALALWFNLGGLPSFLLSMALIGGVLALVALIAKKTNILNKIVQAKPQLLGPQDGWLASLAAGETVVPYGIAIAGAAALTIF